MVDSELNRLRQEALKLHAAVGNKISRTKRNTGANIAGTEFDPRRNRESLERANRATLRKAIEEMKPFMQRSTQFVAGAYGVPLPRHRASVLETLQKNLNKLGQQHENSLKELPGVNKIIENKTMLHPTADGGGGLGPYNRDTKKLSGITSAEALEEVIDSLKKKATPDYLKSQLDQGRHNAIEAAKQLGDLSIIEGIAGLSDYQFDYLWYGTNFAESLFLKYEAEKKRQEGNSKERWQDRVIDEHYQLIGDFLEQASNLPTERPTT